MVAAKELTGTTVNIPVTIAQLSRVDGSKPPMKIAIGAIKVGDLVVRYRMAHRDPLLRSGYQRAASTQRVNDLANNLRQSKVDLPTAILLNLRDFHAASNVKQENDKTVFSIGMEPLYVVDGQHRVEALRKLYEEEPERWSDFILPFVCLLGGGEFEEMEEFYVVNSNAKSISTGLAFDLLKQRAESSPIVTQQLQESGKGWIPGAEKIVEQLAGSANWQGKIRFPLQPKAQTVISNNGLAVSFKPLLTSQYFGGLSMENQVKILEAYWEAIRRIIPDAFMAPTECTLQKSLGVAVMHQVLLSVIEYVRSKNWSVINADSYTQAMKETLQQLSGDTASGEEASGADFWKSAPHGAAGSFSSYAGQRVLIARIRNNLPRMEIN